MPEDKGEEKDKLGDEASREKVTPGTSPEDPAEGPVGEAEARERGGKDEGGPTDEDLRRLVEESLEKVTVSDIVLYMMNQLASMAYLRLGLPESVNLKYRDFRQARLAIDVLDAMIKAGEGKLDPESLKPFRGTLANLQMNFVQLVKVKGEG
jgi:hypothetical protein